jgi:membrane protein required for colicin V production
MAKVFVDSTIAVIIFGSLYEGYRRGLMKSLLGLVGFGTVLLLCLSFGESLSRPLKPYVPLPMTYATLAAYILICFVIALVAYFLQGLFARLLTRRLPPALDGIGGMFVGALRGAVFTGLCLVILMLIANPILTEQITKRSHLGTAFFEKVGKVSPTVKDIYTAPSSPVTTKKVVKPEHDYEKALDSFEREDKAKAGS